MLEHYWLLQLLIIFYELPWNVVLPLTFNDDTHVELPWNVELPLIINADKWVDAFWNLKYCITTYK